MNRWAINIRSALRTYGEMKPHGIYLSAILLLILSVGISGQDEAKAVLVDEHGRLACDDLLGRLDSYFAELDKIPRSIGVVVLSSPKAEKRLAVFRQYFIEAHAKDRKFESSRLKYVRANSGDELSVQLWRIPPRAAEPDVSNVDMSYSLPIGIRPFILGGEYTYGDGICPEVDDAPVFAYFLKDNPDSRGNIVVRDRSIVKATQRAKKIRREFRVRYGIPSSRLRFFPRKASVPENNLEPIVEYWYLP